MRNLCNFFIDNLAYGVQIAAHYTGGPYGGAKRWLVANNTIAYHKYGSAIVVWNKGDDIRIENNIFYENSELNSSNQQGVRFLNSQGSSVTIRNNLSYASGSGGKAFIGGDGAGIFEGGNYTQSNNIVNTANPNLAGDFKLNAGSPAIDKGRTLSEVTWDHAGGKRPYGAVFDIGAYEFGAPPDSGSPPPNPTGGGGGGVIPGIPPILGPNGEVCATGFVMPPIQ